MAIAVFGTTLAAKQSAALRGPHKEAYDEFVESLSATGCAALSYRLTGDLVDHVCVRHLRANMRVLVMFENRDAAWVLLVGRHDASAYNIYDLLYEAAGVAAPQGERTKPACCDIESNEPPVLDAANVDAFVMGIRHLTRR
jgi:hypothetical protein